MDVALPDDASKDQNSCPDGYYRKSNGMLHIIPAPQTLPAGVKEVDITDIAALEALAMSELVAIVQTAPRGISKIPAVKELLDRVKGKAAQSINMRVDDNTLANKISISELIALAKLLPEPIAIAPLPHFIEHES